MKIDLSSLDGASRELAKLELRASKELQNAQRATISRAYSPASGFDQMGHIHGQSLNTAPGSAESVMRSLAAELGTYSKNLNATSAAVASHDDTHAHVLDRVDTGSAAGTSSSHNLGDREASGTHGMYTEPIVTVPAASILQFKNSLVSGRITQAVESLPVWASIQQTTRHIGSELEQLSQSIASANSGAAADAMSQRLSTTTNRANTISGHAQHFHERLTSLDSTRSDFHQLAVRVYNQILALEATGPEGKAAAEVLERMFLGYAATATQASLTGLLPGVPNLTHPETANPGVDLEAKMSGVDSTGSLYSAKGITAPQGLVDQVLNYHHANPGALDGFNAATREFGKH
ncbi:hypothetical protein, partial [Corynebacterium tapiri]